MIPAVEHTYDYGRASARRVRGGLGLATSGGVVSAPTLFVGRILQPDLVADGLLVVGSVARSRYHVPAAMLARILLAADPIVTVGDGRLRFESLSACSGVYVRLDLLPDAVDGTALGRGTTNVDLGPGLRRALAGVDARSAVDLEIGSEWVEVRVADHGVRERRVPLPARWIRSLTEVAAIQPQLQRRAILDRTKATSLLRNAMRLAINRPAWLVTHAGSSRLAHHPAAGSVAIGGPGRLRAVERLLRHVRTLTVHAGADGTTAWELDLGSARLSVVLSPEAWRGFSGEGRQLEALAAPSSGIVRRVRAALTWQPTVDVDAIATELRVTADDVRRALAVLATAGVVGYDLADAAYFHRELPFDLGALERRHPRLTAARQIAADGRVRPEEAGEDRLVAWVGGAGVEHRVALDAAGWSCTCSWYARHRTERGPCKHILAVQIAQADDDS